MNYTQIEKNTNYYLEIFITDRHGDPVTGLTIDYVLYKCSDDSTIDSGTLIELSNGVYQKSYAFDVLGQFRAIYTTPEKYSDESETIFVFEKRALQADLLRTLGLTQENFKMFDMIYDASDNMTFCKIRTYPSKADCNNNTNHIAEYEVIAEYNIANNCTFYKSVLI